MKRKILYAFVLGAFLLSACDQVQQQNEKDTVISSVESSEAKTKNAEEFVREAYKNNLREIEIGKLGQKNARSAEVKAFADMLVEHHSRANEELLEIASSLSIDKPKGNEQKVPDIAALENRKAGEKFDKKFLKMAGKRHKKDLDLYESAAKDLDQEELKNYARNNVPVIQEHLNQAETLEASVKSDSEDSGM